MTFFSPAYAALIIWAVVNIPASASTFISNVNPTKIYSEWTIIGQDSEVTALGYAVEIEGTNAALTQQDGAYLSGQVDRRLFTNGADKAFLTLDSGFKTGSRVAAAPRPVMAGSSSTTKNVDAIQSIMAVGGHNVVYVCVLSSGSWCRHADSKKCDADNEYMYKYAITSTKLELLGREVSVADGLIFTSGFAPTGQGGNGAIGLFSSKLDWTQWELRGTILQGGSKSFGAALAIVASSTFPGNEMRSGRCDPRGAVFPCRFAVGEPHAGKVHIFSHDGDGFVTEQVLQGLASFGTAISSTAHTGHEMLLIGSPEEGQTGVMHVYEWDSDASRYVAGGSVAPAIAGFRESKFGVAIDHIVAPHEVRIVVGAPGKARMLVMRTTKRRPPGGNRIVTVTEDFDGRSRSYPNSPDSVTTKLGASVAIGLGYIYVGAPRFNTAKSFDHSVGAVHVVPYCSENEYVDLSSNVKGAFCKACPSPATSKGRQSMSCSGCTGIPGALPRGAEIRSGCSVSCEGSEYYDVATNKCLYTPSPTPISSQDTGSNLGFLMVVGILVILCILGCFCYICCTPQRANTLQNTGEARTATAESRACVNLEAYPVTLVEEGLVLPNNAESCVICIADFKPGEQIRTLSCKHVFHKPCIDSWLETHSTCPLCNIQLATMALNRPTEAVVHAHNNGPSEVEVGVAPQARETSTI